jgi:hypothetical protein
MADQLLDKKESMYTHVNPTADNTTSLPTFNCLVAIFKYFFFVYKKMAFLAAVVMQGCWNIRLREAIKCNRGVTHFS